MTADAGPPRTGPARATAPVDSLDADGLAHTRFQAIGTTIRLVTTDPRTLAEATEIARTHLDALDLAVSRFRTDSEVSRLADAARSGQAWAKASPTFAGSLRAALKAARLTAGLVDPTVGRALEASGYDTDIDVVRARTSTPGRAAGATVPGWQQVVIEPASDRVTIPAGCLLDLGATAKAHAADVIARRLAARLTGGFLVNLGGDIATSGMEPPGRWQVAIEDADGATLQVIGIGSGQGVATSSTRLRTWAVEGGQRRHHIIDPRTGRTARTPWAQVTCVAADALEANAASTAAVVLGDQAPTWLTGNGIPARLDGSRGTVTTPGWPDPEEKSR